jgi:pimeloyl-ACP methyl ester carboxylesterase
MAYADNNGVRIHYQVEGNGPPLVLQHGYSDSLESWYDFGYVEQLKSERQVILIDARGHGASDQPHNTAE